ncbi:hypothetical protein AAG906_039566 [Vitis piasezkii]
MREGSGHVVKIADLGVARRVGEQEVQGSGSRRSLWLCMSVRHPWIFGLWDARDPKRRWTADMLMNHPFVVLLPKPKRTPTPMVQSCSSFLPSSLPSVIPSQLSNEVVDRGSKKEDKRRHTEFLGRMAVESYLKRRIAAELL